jgi:L-seryl-tRNA(Ser) seleniumtransferase
VLPSAIVTSASPDVLRALPPAHAVLDSPEAHALAATLSRDALRDLVRDVIATLRDDLLAARLTGTRESLAREAAARLPAAAARRRAPRLRRVINATGVVLHTNLGRAPLSDAVLAEVTEACRGYATLEYDLAAGRRGHRDALVAPLLAAVLGADDAAVVNNCAAAVLLAVTSFAQGREVLVSRGQLVEIGGGFRIPDVIASCGARLVEVGTTNRTRVADYERAITPQTAAILEVHRSNFALVGFTEEAPVSALAALAQRHGLAMLEDLGSGALVDTAAYGLPRERTARDAIADGVDLVMVSGDKLLGGPQAGVLAGRTDAIAKVRRHPLMRALRPGRLVLAALEATLRAYAEGRATRDVAAVATLAQPEATVEARARGLAAAVLKQLAAGVRAEVTVLRAEGQVGGGTLPTATVASWAVRIGGIDATTWERRLRVGDPPVVARIKDGALLLDARTMRDDEVLPAAMTVAAAAGEGREMADGEAADDDPE